MYLNIGMVIFIFMKKKVKNFSIVIPTYKENDNFISLLEAIYKYNKQIRNQFELIFVDDNSGDGIAQNFKKNKIFTKILNSM